MLYTVDEVAKMLGVHTRTIRRYIEKGQLHGERIGGSWRIPEEAVMEMFNTPETKEAMAKHFSNRSQDMVEQYLQGKHRLQLEQDSSIMLHAFVFDPIKETWLMSNTTELMAEINRLGQTNKLDFTLTGDEQGFYRLTLIAPPIVLQGIITMLEYLRTGVLT